MSLVELLTATAILTLVAAAIAALSATVQTSNTHGHGHATAVQHARVAMERMERTLREATASEAFPGCAVFGEVVAGERYPETLVVWRPASGTALSPAVGPLMSELVVFRPDPLHPNELLEMTVTGDTRPAPLLTDTAAWATELANLRFHASYVQVRLTDLLRTAAPSGGSLTSSSLRGVVRFELEQTPGTAEIADARAGNVAWKDLPWVQGIHGASIGLRQSRCRLELQLMPGDEAQALDAAGLTAVPFFGSASLLYEVRK